MASGYKRAQGSWDKKGEKDSPKVLLSFEDLDIVQGQTLKQWSDAGILLKLIEVTAVLNKLTFSQAITQSLIAEYNVNDNTKFSADGMPKDSEWKYPINLKQERVKWCKIRLGSTRRVIGFMKENVFHVVFLDKNHKFYPSEPNNT